MKKSGLFQTKHLVKPGILAFTSSISLTCNAAIIINEIDYDQPGTDTAEFIELFNSGSSTVSLDNYFIELLNGNNSSSYKSIDLAGFNISSNDYLVVCGDSSQVVNCDYSFTTTSGWLQNGAPDAVALFENGNILDSISYEGPFSPYTEGDYFTGIDNGTLILSIGRVIDGIDTNNNMTDFQLGCITPGSANIAGSGDCSVSSVSAVPLPAAAWLFGSGIIGLVGLARRK